jgi:hypothetical protein
VQTGSVIEKAVDESGAAMPGVTVTLTSPVLPRPLTGVTDADGVCRFPSLTVGTYTVKATIQGFQTVSREAVVLQGQTATIETTMKIGQMTEEVTVMGEAPVVDAKTTGVSINIDRNLIDSTPGGKDIWSLLEYKAPGVVMDQSASSPPDVGGNQGGLQRGMSARGVPNAQNTQLLNGVNVNDPAAQGFSMNYYTPDTFDNVQVSTAAQDISVGTGGVLINMVSRSGTNRFLGALSTTCQGSCGVDTQAANIDSSQQALGLGGTSNTTEIITNTNGQGGGPLLKNRLFYFGSVNFQATHVNVIGFPAIPPAIFPTLLASTSQQDTTDILAGEGKLTYQPSGRNHFEGYLSKQRYDKPNRGANSGNTQDSDSKELDTFVIAQASWNMVMTNRMFLDSRISYNNTHFPLMQKTGLEPLTDNFTGNLYRNRTSSALMYRRRLEVTSNWQYSVPKLFGGRHDFKAGFDNGYTPETVTTTRVDNVSLTMTTTSGTPRATQVQVFNTPTIVDRAVMTTALYGQDSYAYRRLSVTAGIRWERVEGYLPPQHTPSSSYFPEGLVFNNVTIAGIFYPTYTVKTSFDPVHDDPLWHNFAPRTAVTYDLTGRGRTILKFAAGKYLDQINTGTPPNPNGSINQTYAWNDTNGDFIFQPGSAAWDPTKNAYVGGEFGALSSTSIPNPAGTFDKSLRRPYRNELSVSVDHELFPTVLLSVSFQHMREHDQQGTIDSNIDSWPQNYTLVTLRDPGRDGVANTGDEQDIQAYSLVPGSVVSNKTVNDDRLSQHYNGLEVDVSKRYSRGAAILAGYTYSHTRQDLLGLGNPNNVYVNAGGESGGRRHNFKVAGSYELPYQVQVGVNYRISSGLPITRTWAVPVCTASVVSNCLNASSGTSVTINAEPRGSVLLPSLGSLDLRAGRFFMLGGSKFDVSVDVFNVTNANTVFAVRTNTSTTTVRLNNDPANPQTSIASFLSPTGVLAPRILRFNLQYTFGGR